LEDVEIVHMAGGGLFFVFVDKVLSLIYSLGMLWSNAIAEGGRRRRKRK